VNGSSSVIGGQRKKGRPVSRAAHLCGRLGPVQQLQFLQVHGLQRQPPFVQLQVQAFAVFSIFSMAFVLSIRAVDSAPVKGL
jgi:hypothetical protein